MNSACRLVSVITNDRAHNFYHARALLRQELTDQLGLQTLVPLLCQELRPPVYGRQSFDTYHVQKVTGSAYPEIVLLLSLIHI